MTAENEEKGNSPFADELIKNAPIPQPPKGISSPTDEDQPSPSDKKEK